MPDDIREIQELVPAHLSDNRRDGTPKAAQLKAGAGISAIIPTTLEEAYRYSIAVIGAGLAPASYEFTEGPEKGPDPQKVMIGILKSLEVGLPPITGLSTIAIINKRAVIWGDGAVALVQSKGLVDRIEAFFEGAEGTSAPVTMDNGEADYSPTTRDFPDDFTAVFRIWRKGQQTPYEGRFSVRDARRAKLWNDPKKIPWMQYPKRMLSARARAFALRDGFADALAGLAIREEIEDLPAVQTAPETTDTSFLDDARPAIAPPTETPVEIPGPAIDAPELPLAVTP